MSTEQYARIAAVNVFVRQEQKGSDGAQMLANVDPTGTQYLSQLADGTTGFRIKFHVQKAIGPVPKTNQCTISLYNLGPNSRPRFQFNNLVVLQAGYGKNLQNTFTGNVLTAKTFKAGPDYITEVQVADGAFAFQNAMVNQNFGKGTSQTTIIQSICNTMAASGITVGVINGVPTTNVNQGLVVSGKATQKLREICDKNNLSFSIQDGQVIILPFGDAKSQEVIEINENTGLIGIPEIRDLTAAANATQVEQNTSLSPNSKQKAPRISFKCLMNPKIGCQQIIHITSKFVTGTYTTTLVSHSGDTDGKEWYTDVEAS